MRVKTPVAIVLMGLSTRARTGERSPNSTRGPGKRSSSVQTQFPRQSQAGRTVELPGTLESILDQIATAGPSPATSPPTPIFSPMKKVFKERKKKAKIIKDMVSGTPAGSTRLTHKGSQEQMGVKEMPPQRDTPHPSLG